jgi:hypothetical protein
VLIDNDVSDLRTATASSPPTEMLSKASWPKATALQRLVACGTANPSTETQRMLATTAIFDEIIVLVAVVVHYFDIVVRVEKIMISQYHWFHECIFPKFFFQRKSALFSLLPVTNNVLNL